MKLFRAFVVVAMLATLPLIGAPKVEASSCPCNLLGNATPVTADDGPDSSITLGMYFQTSIDGYVTGMRFYKSAANTGTHTGNLWEQVAASPGTGIDLASVTFTGETSSGWQTATFAKPIYIKTGREYVISYVSPTGHYAADEYYFNSLPTSGPLSVISPGGTYEYVPGQMPADTWHNTNYYVDVTFTPNINADSLSGMSRATPANPTYSGSSYMVVGTRFSSDINTRVLGIRYWGNNPWYNAVPVKLWRSDGTLLASDSYGDTDWPSGWIEVFFDTPVTITAGQEYVASYDKTGASIGFQSNVFTSPTTHGPFHTPSHAGVGSMSAGNFPSTQTNDNYFVEPIFALEASVSVSATIDPSMTFSIANKSSACNGEPNFVSGAGSATGVALGHLVAGSSTSGAQALTVTGNSGHGFAVYIRGAQSSQNLRNASHNWTDVAGSYSSPAALGGGERFGYTYADGTTSSSVTNPSSANFAALTNTNRAVMGSTTSGSGTGCVGFTAQAAASTQAGAYSGTVVYLAVPVY